MYGCLKRRNGADFGEPFFSSFLFQINLCNPLALLGFGERMVLVSRELTPSPVSFLFVNRFLVSVVGG